MPHARLQRPHILAKAVGLIEVKTFKAQAEAGVINEQALGQRLRRRLAQGFVEIVEERLVAGESVLYETDTRLVPAIRERIAALREEVVYEVGNRWAQEAMVVAQNSVALRLVVGVTEQAEHFAAHLAVGERHAVAHQAVHLADVIDQRLVEFQRGHSGQPSGAGTVA